MLFRSGIVINNAIVLLERVRIETEDNGLAPFDAIVEAAPGMPGVLFFWSWQQATALTLLVLRLHPPNERGTENNIS